MIKVKNILIIALVLTTMTTTVMAAPSVANILHIDRKHRKIYVLNGSKVIYKSECGVGRGGLKIKKKMSDFITPTGEFVVDLILYVKPQFNTISMLNFNKYKSSKNYSSLASPPDGLSRLFQNMNNIDFDKNGKADQAYGLGYIGLNSNRAVTGPKMRMYGSVPYWFSIALHGTPNNDNVGQANSGGCIHLSEKDITYLVENRIVKIGTQVIISDLPPYK
jgi:hypothetical protein